MWSTGDLIRERDSKRTAARFQKGAREAERQADSVREVLLGGKSIGVENSQDVRMMKETGEPRFTTPSEG